MKQSKLRRKYVNAMDSMADVPKPARRFTYPPTLSTPLATSSTCERLIDVRWKRRRIRRSRPEFRVCGAPLVLVPYGGRLTCPVHGEKDKLDRRLAHAQTRAVFDFARRTEPWSLAKAASGRFFSRRKV